MRSYQKNRKPQDYFGQGFRLGLVFGVLGAIIILGRDHSPQQTIPERTPAEPAFSSKATPAEIIAPEPEVKIEIVSSPAPAPIEITGPIAQG